MAKDHDILLPRHSRDPKRPLSLPTAIPTEAADLFFGVSPHQQKKLLDEASKPNRIRLVGQTPHLRSRKTRENGGLVCMCDQLRKCPYEAAHAPEPTKDGITYQFYPNDQGWWQLRDAVSKLAIVCGIGESET